MSELMNYLNIHEKGIDQDVDTVDLNPEGKYYDPDSSSLKLYKDFQTIFSNRTFPSGDEITKVKIMKPYGLQLTIATKEGEIVYKMGMAADYFGI